MPLNGYCYSHELNSIFIDFFQGVSVSHFFLEKQYIFLIFLSCKKNIQRPPELRLNWLAHAIVNITITDFFWKQNKHYLNLFQLTRSGACLDFSSLIDHSRRALWWVLRHLVAFTRWTGHGKTTYFLQCSSTLYSIPVFISVKGIDSVQKEPNGMYSNCTK